jgi:hypothetical protein
MKKLLAAAAAFLTAGALAVVLVIGALAGAAGGSLCGGKTDTTTAVAHAPIAGFQGEQLGNAAQIMAAATALGLDSRAQTVGVMTAIGESGLRNLSYGDDINGVTNPDGTATCSLGLFQQQWCLEGHPWGQKADVTNPVTAATSFFKALKGISGWEQMSPTAAAHAVQGNSDPNYYTPFLEPATQIVNGLTETGITSGTVSCQKPAFPAANGKEPGAWGGYENGRIPLSALTPIPWAPEYSLRADATTALTLMNAAFRQQFGYDLPINDAYRDYAGQVAAKAEYGDGAAEPGQSNHGWALAIDIGDQSHYTIGYSDPIYLWLQANAGNYGWAHPDWAEPDGRGPHEAWHWEYRGIAA